MLPREDWLQVVRSAPLVSMDLIVRDTQARVLLGQRNNAPAKGSWFVPGGAIRKNERLDEAYARITRNELGSALKRSEAKLLGIYEHHYEDNFAGETGVGTHYIVLAHELWMSGDFSPADNQHEHFRWFAVAELLGSGDVHHYTKAYFAANAV